MQFRLKPIAAALMFSAGLMLAQGAQAVEVAAGDLDAALRGLASESGIQILFDANELKGARTSGVHDAGSAEEALKQLLKGTNYIYTPSGSGTYVIKVAPPQEKMTEMSPIEVRGTKEAAILEKSYVAPIASTATKTDTPVMETPMNVQVVSTQALEDQKASTLTEALSNVSGIVSTRGSLTAGPGEYLTLRGFAGTGPATNIMTDGVRFENSTALTQMANVESVEVLKGPAAILYGRMEPGGVVNVVTKKPMDTPYHSIEQRVGSWNTYNTRVDSTGPINEDKSLLYRINLGYDDAGSWREGQVFSKTSLIAPSLLWKISPQTQVGLDLKHDETRAGDDFQATPWVNGQPALIPWSRNLGEPSPSNTKNDSVGLSLAHEFNDAWAVKAKLNQDENKYHSMDTTVDWLYTGGPYTWSADRSLTSTDLTRKNDFLSFDVTGHFDTAALKHTLLLGADRTHATGEFTTAYGFTDLAYTSSTIDVLNPNHPGIPTPLFIDPSTAWTTKINNTQSGLYVQDQIDLSHNVFVTAGLRQQKYDSHAESTGSYTSTSDRSESAVTPRAGILWRAQQWLSVYGGYTESFGAGAGTQFGGAPMPATGAKQYEVGAKTEAFGGKLRSTLAYFDLAKTNIGTRDTVHCPALPAACQWMAPIGEQRSKGVELDVQGEIQPDWNLIFSYAQTDAKTTKNNTQPFKEGDRLAGVPANMASLWTTYAFRQESLQGLKVGGGVNWRDASAVDRYSAAAPQQTPNPAYSVVNAMASYAFKSGTKKWTAQFNINNLLNEKYWTVFQEPGSGFAYINYGTPRSATASLKLEL